MLAQQGSYWEFTVRGGASATALRTSARTPRTLFTALRRVSSKFACFRARGMEFFSKVR